MNVEVNWQDADLSSAKGFRYSYDNEQESKIMLCGGHVGWAHGKKVQELQKMTSFSSDFFNLYKGDFPNLTSVKYCCARKKHVFVAMRNKLVCRCIGSGFIQSAKQNYYCPFNWFMLGRTLKNTGKQCLPWVGTTAGTSTSEKVVLVHFTP